MTSARVPNKRGSGSSLTLCEDTRSDSPSRNGRIVGGVGTRRIIAVLQRFLRGVCRMWTLGPLGENGRWLTGTINRFLFLTGTA